MIINDIKQFEDVIPTALGIKFNTIKTYIDSAERTLKNDILGKDLYSKIDSIEDEELQTISKSYICLDAYNRAIPFLDLVQTANGFAVVSNTNLAPASKGRVDRLIAQTALRRDEVLENLICYLEESKQYHDDWKGSPSYSVISACLIQTAKELKHICSWTGDRSDFLKMKPTLLLCTKTELYKCFGAELIEEIIEQQRDNDISPANSNIIESLKFCLANFAIAKNSEATRLRDMIVNFLDKDIESFPKYANSPEYKAKHAERFKNKKDSSVFIFGGGM